MNRDLAKTLLLVVNDREIMGRIEGYVDSRIRYLSEHLLNERDVDRIREIQGAVRELKRFSTLRDEVRQAADGTA